MEDLVKVHGSGGYDSDFSDEDGHGESSEKRLKRKREEEILQKPFERGRYAQVAHRSFHTSEIDREEARNRRAHLISLNAFERHKKFVSDYILYYGGQMADLKRSTTKDKTDYDVVRENHRFLWREEDEEDMTWEKELAKKYYDKLFKEYCIADLSRYKENKVLWVAGGYPSCYGPQAGCIRDNDELAAGLTQRYTQGDHACHGTVIGQLPLTSLRPKTREESVRCQFQCGHKRCDKQEGLKSWEVNFAYVEQGEKRNALVKLRLCPECSFKLNYHHKRKEVKAKTKTKRVSEENRAPPPPKKRKKRKHSSSHSKKHKHKMRRDHSPSSSSTGGSSDSDKDSEAGEESEGQSEADHWRGPAPAVEEKSREEEFDDYFEDMFL